MSKHSGLEGPVGRRERRRVGLTVGPWSGLEDSGGTSIHGFRPWRAWVCWVCWHGHPNPADEARYKRRSSHGKHTSLVLSSAQNSIKRLIQQNNCCLELQAGLKCEQRENNIETQHYRECSSIKASPSINVLHSFGCDKCPKRIQNLQKMTLFFLHTSFLSGPELHIRSSDCLGCSKKDQHQTHQTCVLALQHRLKCLVVKQVTSMI